MSDQVIPTTTEAPIKTNVRKIIFIAVLNIAWPLVSSIILILASIENTGNDWSIPGLLYYHPLVAVLGIILAINWITIILAIRELFVSKRYLVALTYLITSLFPILLALYWLWQRTFYYNY